MVWPWTSGSVTNDIISTPVMLYRVLMAEMPFAPPLLAAKATGTMSATLGVNFARIGREVPRRTAAVNRSTRTGSCPIVLPRSRFSIFGQEKLHSIRSAPASWHLAAIVVHSSSSCPIIEAMMTLVGKSFFKRRNTSMFSSTLWSESCSMFLNPQNELE